jgi:hypothetical protein
MDPMSDFMYKVDRLPASAIEVYRAIPIRKVDSVSVVKYEAALRFSTALS